MSSECINIDFVYAESPARLAHDHHIEAFEKMEDYAIKGNTVVGTKVLYDLFIQSNSEIHDRWPFESEEQLRYNSGGDSVDLTDLCVVYYRFDELAFLNNNNDHPLADDEGQLLNEVIEIVKVGYKATAEQPVAIYSTTPDMPDIGRPPFTAESLAKDRLTHLCWLTVFTPRLVETYGRETLLSAPAWHVEELDDGAILLVCHDDPSWRSSIQSVADYIGIPSYEEFW